MLIIIGMDSIVTEKTTKNNDEKEQKNNHPSKGATTSE